MRVPSVRQASGLFCQVWAGLYAPWYPLPPFFVTAHSKVVMAKLSVSADSKGLIYTEIVQNLGVLGTAHSKGLSR
jgi:hypothetical protein